MCRDISREQKSVSRNSSNERLLFTALADAAARGIDAAVQGGIRNDATLPDVFDQLVLADHSVRILREIEKKVENLRLDMDSAIGAFKLAPIGIKREIVKFYQQLGLLAVSNRNNRQI